MKYGEILENIKRKDSYNYIDYNNLKKKIENDNFISILTSNIKKFDNEYKSIHVFDNYNTIYKYILVNYLTINKIIKKFIIPIIYL